MRHTSVKLNLPIEFINITPVNPLISKCEIKVCYVDDKPNRNGTIITKETAIKLAQSLPGSPIVGYYSETQKDFEGHNKIIKISNGEFIVEETTKPYGFVDLNAKVWFAKYLDDEKIEREYLVTEGWLWTGQYPEVQRTIDLGNNHSMELDESEKYLKGSWTKDENGMPEFFIINEAIISKLCILGEDCEPCFEGSRIDAAEDNTPIVHFSFSKNFENQLLSMMQDIKNLLNEGGQKKVFSRYSVNINDNIWNGIYKYLGEYYLDNNKEHYSLYRIDGIYEENGQKFVVLQNYANSKYYRVNFSLSDEGVVEVNNSLIEVTSTYETTGEAQFAAEEVETYENNLIKNSENLDNSDEKDNPISDNSSEGTKTDEANENNSVSVPVTDKCDKDKSECTCLTYSLDEIPEYVELKNKYSELETNYNTLLEVKNNLEAEIAPLATFKKEAEKKEKEALIASFYMLSDEDKKNVVDNIDNYSLRDIEAELSIICVRNKVSFALDDNKSEENKVPTTYNLETEDEATPAWVKLAASVAKTLN